MFSAFEPFRISPPKLLQVKTGMVAFSSVYGNRCAFQEVLFITSQDPKNIFHRSSVWRQGMVGDVVMLPRADMVKPPRSDDAKYGADARFTRVQEMKQVGVHKNVKACKHGFI